MRISPRSPAPLRPFAAAAVLAAALPIARAAAGCGGAAEPESRPARAAGAEAPAAPGELEAAPGELEAAAAPAETAPAETAPVNASPTANLEPPAAAPAAAAAERPARRRKEPKPVEVEPRSEWTIDESLPTPADLARYEILAKFPKDDGRMVVIYRRDDGEVFRRVQGRMGGLTLVEETRVEMDE
jgi:hypothetical protein